MTLRLSVTIAVLCSLVCVASAAEAPREWPQHLGPNRNGVSTETGLIDRLPATGPKELWRVKGGVGMSGVAVGQGLAITLAHRDDRQKVLALDARTGATKWQTELADPYRNQMGDGPRATPTISGDKVFVYTGEGILAALNLADGKKLWSHQVVEELKGEQADYGMASSPLVTGGLVIVVAGAPSATVVAYDAGSGELKWKAGNDPAGYSSPALLNLAGKEQVVVATGKSVLGISPADGAILWQYPWVTNYNCNTASPIAVNGKVLISSGENHGSVLLEVKLADGKFAATPVWESLETKSVLRSEWQTPILQDNYLFGFDNVGAAGPVSNLTCIDARTGERLWRQARFGKGNFIAAEGKLFIVTFDGELVIVKASAKAYEELGRAPVVGKTRQAPALCDGLLYLRDDRDIVCLDVKR